MIKGEFGVAVPPGFPIASYFPGSGIDLWLGMDTHDGSFGCYGPMVLAGFTMTSGHDYLAPRVCEVDVLAKVRKFIQSR